LAGRATDAIDERPPRQAISGHLDPDVGFRQHLGMAKPFASRVVPFGEWVLVRRPQEEGGRILVACTDDDGKQVITKGAPLKKCVGIVAAVGPGERDERGAIVPHHPNLTPGATVVFADKAAFQPLPEMKEDGLYFVPCSMIICAILPEGVAAKKPRALAPAGV